MKKKRMDPRDAGAKGGNARAMNNSKEVLSLIGKAAAAKRWSKEPGPKTPIARFQGTLALGTSEVECHVLENEERVLSLRSVMRSIAERETGALADYIGVSALKPFINADLVVAELREFEIPGIPGLAKGMTAETFLEICTAYVNALKSDALATDRQREIAFKCSILLASCAKVGLIALIDEATGYQHVRAEDALQVKLKAFITDELRAWEKTFPDELWKEFGRLEGWQGPLHLRPRWWGKLVMELIYDALDPDIADHLRKNKPPPRAGMNYHQWMTADIGLKSLIQHIYQIIGIAKTCRTMRELRDRVAFHYGKDPMQLEFAETTTLRKRKKP